MSLTCGCQQKSTKPEKSAQAPSKTTRPVAESDLNVIELTEDAIRRLGLETVMVEKRKMVRTRPYGADLVLPTDASVIVSAPLAGTLRSPSDQSKLDVGRRVDKSQPILSIYPLLSPERAVLTPAERIRFAEAKNTLAQSKIDAEGAVQQASVQVDSAQIAFQRAERLLNDMVGTVRSVDEARAQLELAEKGLAAAKLRQSQIDGVILDEDAGTLAAIPIPTPISGILRTVQVQPGEMVAAGAPLFEVMNDEILWVQAPVYVGDLHEIDMTKAARVTMLDGRPSDQDVVVQPIASPPTATPLAAAVDLYFQLPNPNHRFQPGQKIALHLPLTGDEIQTAIPWAAVIHDIYGGQWVYEQTGEREFVRRRVQVGWVDEDWAAIRHGPEVGAKVVTAGAAELAGAEFGFAK
ncbi:efflux RND transporter periplasmic adaptor subunit [Blastopirellula sp. J2-11]|uniref:efflux RND transporter periplasmic adaptor subunit n=1 Tax=Blastopirellula sp. J2-11 TaxID=2943192 RepID=UPI0021CAD9CE|nr:HlyD family efflux transporter periplasmic adaptor subunit [Blastopirellula sp. J2-11]UUO04560.1 efflux RND transporter periplasmic adaptor subunit [Blastopirellula sp. J2-11]